MPWSELIHAAEAHTDDLLVTEGVENSRDQPDVAYFRDGDTKADKGTAWLFQQNW